MPVNPPRAPGLDKKAQGQSLSNYPLVNIMICVVIPYRRLKLKCVKHRISVFIPVVQRL
jgi:hypothetical protein